MVKKTFTFDLDIKKAQSTPPPTLVEGDNGNEFIITLTDNGKPVDLTDCRILLLFSQPNGRTAQQDNDGNGIEMVEGAVNKFTVNVYITSFSPGTNNCEVQVLSGENFGTLVTSAQFNFKCRRSILNEDTIKATDEYPILAKLTAVVEDTVAKLEPIERNEDERIANEEAREQAEEAREQAWTTATAKAAMVEYNQPVSATAEKTADGIKFNFEIPRGAPGKEVVIKQSVIDERGHLMLTYNDGTTVDAGYAKGVLVTDTIPADKKPDILLLTNAKPVSPFITEHATLYAADWGKESEDAEYYSQRVDISGLPANADGGEVQLDETHTRAEYEAAASCGVHKIAQFEGYIICAAYELPEVDLPIQVRWWQGMVAYAAE